MLICNLYDAIEVIKYLMRPLRVIFVEKTVGLKHYGEGHVAAVKKNSGSVEQVTLGDFPCV